LILLDFWIFRLAASAATGSRGTDCYARKLTPLTEEN
jgi:hypothetical protein